MGEQGPEATNTEIVPASRSGSRRPPLRLVYMIASCCGLGLALLVYYALKYLGY